jgi:hypothetical protein
MRCRTLPVALAVALTAATVVSLVACAGDGRRAEPISANAPGAESGSGMVRGEFEDAHLYAKALSANPAMGSWSGKEVCDGLSGATLQNKDFGGKLPDRAVLVDGRIAAYADGFGQYWLALSPGSHVLVGSCRGYRDARTEIVVEEGSTQYVNFFLERR